MQPISEPVASFYRILETTRPPQRADRSACGTLPTRAYRYCEAATSATAFGWWIFPPMDLHLMWDGHAVFWHHEGAPDWMPLLPSAQYPELDAAFDSAAPDDLVGLAPPVMTALPEPGALQIWTGLFARTLEDWHLLVRAPANLPSASGISLFEGIIETDRWFGPLFTNMRLTRTHTPIRLRADYPLAQLQPVQPLAYSDAILNAVSAGNSIRGFTTAEWDDYRSTIVEPNERPDRPFGAYAVRARKRRAGLCPAHNAVSADASA
jgi:Family of unknown function (DUF6065)